LGDATPMAVKLRNVSSTKYQLPTWALFIFVDAVAEEVKMYGWEKLLACSGKTWRTDTVLGWSAGKNYFRLRNLMKILTDVGPKSDTSKLARVLNRFVQIL